MIAQSMPTTTRTSVQIEYWPGEGSRPSLPQTLNEFEERMPAEVLNARLYVSLLIDEYVRQIESETETPDALKAMPWLGPIFNDLFAIAEIPTPDWLDRALDAEEIELEHLTIKELLEQADASVR